VGHDNTNSSIIARQIRNVAERDQTHIYCTTTKRGRERLDTLLLHNYETW